MVPETFLSRATFYQSTVFSCQMKAFIILLFLSLLAGGCVSKTAAQAQARAAYAAGQRDAYAHIAATQRMNIKVFGPVQNPEVPWVEGLTLAQAIATALRSPALLVFWSENGL
jgi:hypothetical protein